MSNICCSSLTENKHINENMKPVFIQKCSKPCVSNSMVFNMELLAILGHKLYSAGLNPDLNTFRPGDEYMS